MARFPPCSTANRAAGIALATAACMVLAAVPAGAQDALELRGAVLESGVADDLAGQPNRTDLFADEPLAPTSLRPRPPARQVAAEETDAAAAVRVPRVDGLDEERSVRTGLDNERTGSIEGRTRQPEEDAFGPLGLRVGSFVLRPRLDQGIGWTTNATNSPGGGRSLFSETGLRLDAVSDWSRHSAAIRADGTFRRSLSGERISEIEGGVDGELRLDLGYELSGLIAGGYRVREEAASAPGAVAGVDRRPLRHTLTGTTGLSRDVGVFRVGLTGNMARNSYGDATLTDGTVISQGERNSTLATAALRLGYSVSPALRPFIEGEGGRRFYDQRLDGAGYARSANRYALRAGIELDLREKLFGEVSAGWLTERPDDDRLTPISGFTAAGRLAWSPVRGTTVELSGSTEVEGTTTPGETGSLLYSGSLAVSRALRADLTGRALVGMDWRDYAGSSGRDLVFRGEASLTWWMNRYLGLTGRARHEMQRSNIPGRDYDASSVYLGMTLQR